MARKNFKAKNYVARPNPVASAMITTRAFSTRKLPSRPRYNRAAERRNTRQEVA